MNRKRLLWGGGAAIVLAALAAAAVIEIDSPELGRAVLRRAGEATGIEMRAERFRWKLLEGLRMEGVEAGASFPGGRYRIALDGILLEHRLVPLLAGELSFDRVVLDAPRVAMEETSSPPPGSGDSRTEKTLAERERTPPGPAEEPPARFGLAIREIRIEDGALLIGPAVEGLALSLRDVSLEPGALSVLHGLSFEGEMEAGEVALESVRLEEVRGDIRLRRGLLEASDLTFRTEHGDFRSELEADFHQIPFGYTLSLEAQPVVVGALTGAAAEDGWGDGHLTLEAKGSGTDSARMKGEGRLGLEAGTLPSTPVLAGLERALGRTHLIGAAYQPTEALFRIEKDRLHLDAFEIATEEAALDLRGWVELAGPMRMELVLRTPREGLKIKEVPEEVLDLLTSPEGWTSLPFLVTGTVEEPRIEPDRRALAELTRQGTKGLLEEKAIETLRDLFRRKKK